MSAFLGPIHVKMYGRVLAQDDMTQAVLDLCAREGWADGLQPRVDARAPAAARAPLEAIIDAGNIHGWLSEAVARCERRFALAVCGALEGHPERLAALQSAMRELGRAVSLPHETGAEQAFQALHDLLLDGMPCDFPFAIAQADAQEAAWQVVNCPHAPYWAEAGCEADLYYRLRDAWVEGALEGSGLVHLRPAPHQHRLRKEARHG